MAGLIRRADIDEVRERINIADVIDEYVTLRRAGPGSLKGLCPFHDEKTPSFHVRTQNGRYHCFGCGESGDVFSFLQNMDHISFTEAVERLAHRVGVELQYEDGGKAGAQQSQRAAIMQANRAAQEYFQQQLATSEAQTAREFLTERGFDEEVAAQYGLGFAPNSYTELPNALKAQGLEEQHLIAAGILGESDRGRSYPRFRGRLIWPIRDVTGQTIGFGARKLLDSDNGPKYLNTPETAVYHKAKVLYGLDLARKEIARQRSVVIVEGYTDVMACHLAGITTAVATCGTAFGADHIAVIRRIMGDDQVSSGEVVFLFDPDEAGQKAALKAFADEKKFRAQTYVAVPDAGLDPCDLRIEKGDLAVRELIAAKQPMFEFVMKQILQAHDLNSIAGRTLALSETAPIIADIRDKTLTNSYIRYLASALGVGLDEVAQAVRQSSRTPAISPNTYVSRREIQSPDYADGRRVETVAGPATVLSPQSQEALLIQDHRPSAQLSAIPVTVQTRLEVEALAIVLQYPQQIDLDRIAEVVRSDFSHPLLASVRDAIMGSIDDYQRGDWIDLLTERAPEICQLIQELAVLPLPQAEETKINNYITGVTAALLQRQIETELEELFAQLQRANTLGDSDEVKRLQFIIQDRENQRRTLKEQRG